MKSRKRTTKFGTQEFHRKIWITQPLNNAADTLETFHLSRYNPSDRKYHFFFSFSSKLYRLQVKGSIHIRKYCDCVVIHPLHCLAFTKSAPFTLEPIQIQFRNGKPIENRFSSEICIIAKVISFHIDFTFVINDFAKM